MHFFRTHKTHKYACLLNNKKRLCTVKKKYICCVAGCSGGHIIPCLTLAKTTYAQKYTLFFTTARPLDQQILTQAASNKLHHVPLPFNSLSGVQRKIKALVWSLPISFAKIFFHLWRTKPLRIITTGSHIALPVCLAGWLLRIPIDLYEVNVIPGKTIRFLAPYATTIYICSKKTLAHLQGYMHKCRQTTYPRVPVTIDKIDTTALYAKLGFSPHKKTIFILGGSQGSLFLNKLIHELISSTKPSATIQVLHQTGNNNPTTWKKTYDHLNIAAHVFSYQESLAPYYLLSDIIICRSGAGTLAEIIALKKQCITIPLETAATTHQVANALAAAEQHPDYVSVLRQTTVSQTTDNLIKLLIQRSVLPVNPDHC